MKKKLFDIKMVPLFSILVLICIFFVGCASVDFVTYYNSDGTINEYVHLTLDSEELSAYGYNVADTQKQIKTKANAIVADLINDYEHKLLQSYRNNELSLDEYSHFNGGVLKAEQDWENDIYIIGLQFKDSKTYRKYYQLLNNLPESNMSTEPIKVEKTFYTKTYYYGTVGYADYNLFNEIYNQYSLMFSNIPNEKTTLYYSYAMDSRRYHSNADSVTSDTNGNYIHTWKVEPDELEKEIYFYTIRANRSAWLLVCIAIGLGICLILCLVGVHKFRQNKKQFDENEFENLFDKNNLE